MDEGMRGSGISKQASAAFQHLLRCVVDGGDGAGDGAVPQRSICWAVLGWKGWMAGWIDGPMDGWATRVVSCPQRVLGVGCVSRN